MACEVTSNASSFDNMRNIHATGLVTKEPMLLCTLRTAELGYERKYYLQFSESDAQHFCAQFETGRSCGRALSAFSRLLSKSRCFSFAVTLSFMLSATVPLYPCKYALFSRTLLSVKGCSVFFFQNQLPGLENNHRKIATRRRRTDTKRFSYLVV